VADGITASGARPGPVSGGAPGPRRAAPQPQTPNRAGAHGEPPPGGDTSDREASLWVGATVTAGTATVVLRGELDLAALPVLAGRLAQVLAGRPDRLVLDMSGVAFIDCASARLLAGAGRHLPGGVRPAVRSPSPVARRVLELTGLADHVDMVPPGTE
jgi:anti-anti-sigma factor